MTCAAGQWVWSIEHREACRVVETQNLWGDRLYRVWVPTKDAIVRVRSNQLCPTAATTPRSTAWLSYVTAAARISDALSQDILLAPIEASVMPLAHQIRALGRAVSEDRVGYVLADEVGLGKTVEAGLIMRELYEPDEQLLLFPELSEEEWADLDGQDQMETLLTSRVRALKNERAEVEVLLEAARRTEVAGADAKAEALLDWIYRLQQEEADPDLKVLMFTEFPDAADAAGVSHGPRFLRRPPQRIDGNGGTGEGSAIVRRAGPDPGVDGRGRRGTEPPILPRGDQLRHRDHRLVQLAAEERSWCERRDRKAETSAAP